MMNIEPLGMSKDDLASIYAHLACCSPGATDVMWHYSETNRIVLVGVVRDRTLHQWLMQPAASESEAERLAARWSGMLSNAKAVEQVLAAVGSAVGHSGATH